jgi:hypothetical protein
MLYSKARSTLNESPGVARPEKPGGCAVDAGASNLRVVGPGVGQVQARAQDPAVRRPEIGLGIEPQRGGVGPAAEAVIGPVVELVVSTKRQGFLQDHRDRRRPPALAILRQAVLALQRQVAQPNARTRTTAGPAIAEAGDQTGSERVGDPVEQIGLRAPIILAWNIVAIALGVDPTIGLGVVQIGLDQGAALGQGRSARGQQRPGPPGLVQGLAIGRRLARRRPAWRSRRPWRSEAG